MRGGDARRRCFAIAATVIQVLLSACGGSTSDLDGGAADAASNGDPDASRTDSGPGDNRRPFDSGVFETPPVADCAPPSETGLVVHELTVLEDLSQPVWTFSPLHVRLRVSAPDLPSGETRDASLMLGVVPPPSERGLDPATLEDHLCALEILTLRGVSTTETVHEFEFPILQDDCFGRILVDQLQARTDWNEIPDNGVDDDGDGRLDLEDFYYTVNLGVQPLPCDAEEPSDTPPVFFVNELASTPANAACSSPDVGAGCVWNVPVSFTSSSIDIRLTSVTPVEPQLNVWMTAPSVETFTPPAADVLSTIIAFGNPTDREGLIPLPGGISLVTEYWVAPRGAGSRGELVAVTVDPSPTATTTTTSISQSEFVLNTPAVGDHSIYLPESVRLRFLSGGAWETADAAVLTSCIRLSTTPTPDEADCRSVTLPVVRAIPPSQIRPIASCDDFLTGSWYRSYGQWDKAIAYVSAWSDSFVDNRGGFSYNGLFIDGYALSGQMSRRLVDGSLNLEAQVERPTGRASYQLLVLGRSVIPTETRTGTFEWPSARETISETLPSLRVPLGPVTIRVALTVEGMVGFDVRGVAEVADGPGEAPFDTHDRHGALGVVMEPFASAAVRLDVAADFLVVRAGLSGSVELVSARLPVQARAEWGTTAGRIEGRLSGSLDLTVGSPNGTINGYIESWNLFRWRWERRSYPLMTFGGSTWTYPLLRQSTPTAVFQCALP